MFGLFLIVLSILAYFQLFVARDDLEEMNKQLGELEKRTETYLFKRGWEDRSDDRKNYTAYRNTTKFPIEMVVSVWAAGSGQGNKDCSLDIFIDGKHVLQDDQRHEKWRTTCSGAVTVPPDAEYKIEASVHHRGTPMAIKWLELSAPTIFAH